MAKLNEWGKIIKGVNTTQDVNIHSISQQDKKFGNIVNDDGCPKYNIADYMEYLKKDLKESWLNETENRTFDIMLNKKFQNWFRGSKVVDDLGFPLVCFHGTDAEFSNFNTLSHFGSVEAANEILNKKSENNRIIPVYLCIKQPLEIKDFERNSNLLGMDLWQIDILNDAELREIYSKEMFDKIKQIEKNAGHKLKIINFVNLKGKINRKKLISILKQKGYDGLKYKNYVEGNGDYSWIIFNSNQVWPIFQNKPDKKSKLSESNNYKYKEVFSFGNEVEYNFFDDDNILHAITLYMKNNILTIDIENKITSKKIENTYNNIINNFVKKYEPYQIKLKQQNPYIIKSLEANGYEYNNNTLTKIIKEFINAYKPIKKNSWNYPEELEDYLIKNDFKQIGSGEFSSVWKSPSKENFVVKIFRSKEYNSSVDKEWYDYCRKNSNNPHLPKVGSLKDFGEWYVIFIEKLESIPNDINVDSMKIFKEAIKQNLKPDDVNFEEKFLSLSSNYDTNFVDELTEIYPTIYDIYQKIVKPRKSIQVRLDLHLSNMMLRGNTLVITDPIKSFLRNV